MNDKHLDGVIGRKYYTKLFPTIRHRLKVYLRAKEMFLSTLSKSLCTRFFKTGISRSILGVQTRGKIQII